MLQADIASRVVPLCTNYRVECDRHDCISGVHGSQDFHSGSSIWAVASQENGTVVHGTTAQVAITVAGIVHEDMLLCYRLCADKNLIDSLKFQC